MTEVDRRAVRRALVAGSVGNFIEWYDFTVYQYVAPVLALAFFPHAGSLTALLDTYGVFALAFVFRPAGGVFFGRLADRIGRRPTLALVLTLMMVGTTIVGVLPSYHTIGVAAPILLTLCRCLQGFSAGGEFGGAVALMVEFAPPGKRGRYGSWQQFTVALGLVAGSALVWLLSGQLSTDELNRWGWRIPFLVCAPLGLVALYLRLKVEETPQFERLRADRESHVAPPSLSPRQTLARVLFMVGTQVAWTITGYVFLVALPVYVVKSGRMTLTTSLVMVAAANLALAVSVPLLGTLSDHIGRKPVMLTGAVGIVALAYPLARLIDTAQPVAVQGALVVAALLTGLFAGPGPAMFAELFPTGSRSLGMSLGYSLSTAVFGGTATWVSIWLITLTHNPLAPAFYAIAAGLVSAACLSRLNSARTPSL
jgi:MFS family permease